MQKSVCLVTVSRRLNSKIFFVSYAKGFLDFGRETSQCLKVSAWEGPASYNPVPYTKKMSVVPFRLLILELDNKRI